MEAPFERIRRHLREQESVTRNLLEAILSARIPESGQLARELLGMALAGGPRAAAAKKALVKCGISFGRSGDFVGVHWWRPDSPCVAISAAMVSKHLLQGTAWAGKSVVVIESALSFVPGRISRWEPYSNSEPPIVLISRAAMKDLVSRPRECSQSPGSPDKPTSS